ncbi:MAG: tripartite tricarboxylate transporter TctB family protein [Clostridia bacterium]|nr:tripartite tricarboxylate transporter TctB family protein [Clostridia bacterium]
MRRRGEIIFAVGLMALAVAFVAVALGYNPIARRMPLIVAIFTVIALIAYFIGQLGAGKSEEEKVANQGPGSVTKSAVVPTKNDVRILSWLLVLLASVYALGILVGSALFTVLFYRFEAKQGWLGSVIFGVVLALTLYGAFQGGLQLRLYNGLVMEFFS